MTRLHAQAIEATVAVAMMLFMVSGAGAQETLSARLHPSGLVQVTRGDAELATIELSAHGPQWNHAPQDTATAQVSDLPDQAGKRFVGTLPIPGNEGGAIKYTETVKPISNGLRLEYSLDMTKTMKLDGLQLSIELPVSRYAGKMLVISQPDSNPQVATFPEKQQDQAFQIWSGQGAKLQAAKGSPDAITVELLAATDVMVQDLRRWKSQTFEVRLPAIMDDQGREVNPGDRFHLALTVTFASPIKLVGP